MSRIHLLFAVCLALPLAVDDPAAVRDSSETRISIAGGYGTYALITRGCEGQVLSSDQVHFTDASAALDHHFANPLGVGVRGGFMRVGGSGHYVTTSYVNPHVVADWRAIGLGAGYMYVSKGLPTMDDELILGRPENVGSAHLRVGHADGTHFLISVLENQPLISGGGYFDLGFGFHPCPNIKGFVGLSGGPYDGPGAALGTEIALTPEVLLDLKARLGASESVGENAAAIGLTYRPFSRRSNETSPEPAAPAPP
jgi:hypothetical protein